MSIDLPAALEALPVRADVVARPGMSSWTETTLTVLFTAATVLFVSFVAVVTGLV